MAEKQSDLEILQGLLKQKQSKKWYATKLGISEMEVDILLKELKESGNPVVINPDQEFAEDIEKGTATISFSCPEEIRTLDELISKCKIDTDKWEIQRYVQNYWGNKGNPHWQVKAWLTIKKDKATFQDNFLEFLKDYQPTHSFEPTHKVSSLPNACLVINKQDEHLNKFDVDGDNDIFKRFKNTYDNVDIILSKATLSNNIEQIIYVVGSDEFNSEWTSMTTKGTPQQNILPFEDSFQAICDYEVAMINNLLKYTPNVFVSYIQGNHDEFVGWHMITWLQAYFRTDSRVTFDTGTECTKCYQYSNTGMMFNHGDAIKPAKLANLFPQLFRAQWSSCQHFYIFTGDKHHEKSEDFGGITFYQIPALSKADSKWDKKNGHVGSKAELTAFLIEEGIGRTDIMKRPL